MTAYNVKAEATNSISCVSPAQCKSNFPDVDVSLSIYLDLYFNIILKLNLFLELFYCMMFGNE